MAILHKMWQTYPQLQFELKQTLNLIDQQINTQNPEVTEAIIEMMNAGGKLLRPAYCLLFSQYQKTDRKKMIALAAALETLHTATLIHDDIIDKSETRRHEPSIQARFGQDVAVYAGDYLFIVCFKLISSYAKDLKSVQANSLFMERILGGELAQLSTRYDLDLSLAQYLKQIDGKTGQLFALSCFLGAYESGASLLFANQAQSIGLNIGLAFQMLDDLLDYQQDASKLGKPTLDDMRRGVYSAPLIFALQKQRKSLEPLLQKKEQMTLEDVTNVQKIVIDTGGIEAIMKLAQQYTNKALKQIQKLPQGQTTDQLYQLTSQLLYRQT